MARTPLRSDLGSTRKKPAVPPSAPQTPSRRLRQSEPRARLRHPVRRSRVHLQLPAHRPARLRPLHDRDGVRQAVHRAEEPEALLLELSRRRRVPRSGDQHASSTPSSPRRSRASSASPRAGTCAAASTPTSSSSTARRDGRRRPRSRCPPRRIRPRPRDVGKSAGTADAATASSRPAPYNAIGRCTRGDAAAPDVVFDLEPPPAMTHPLQSTIDLAWEARASLSPGNSPEIRAAVDQVIAGLDAGEIRVAERQGVGEWTRQPVGQEGGAAQLSPEREPADAGRRARLLRQGRAEVLAPAAKRRCARAAFASCRRRSRGAARTSPRTSS